MASICNDERATYGVMSGHDRKTLTLSVLFHNFWAMPADQAPMQQLMFMKNISMSGGLLLMFALGAGPASLDSRRARPV